MLSPESAIFSIHLFMLCRLIRKCEIYPVVELHSVFNDEDTLYWVASFGF